MPILLIVGIGLLLFGAFVLLKFPGRPGGKITFGTVAVSSVGAGLPLIFLGVICILVYSGNSYTDFWPFNEEDSNGNGTNLAGCFDAYLDTIPSERIQTLESGTADFDIIGPQQSKDEKIAIIFSELNRPIGAIKFSFILNNKIFKIESIVDAQCGPIENYSNTSRGGDKHVLQNWDTVEMQIGDSRYELRLGYDGGIISANYFRKVSP
ncbi:hypothetical protein GWO43_27455 [candidate division KSB1 bacterium]|nr:hypothetical protein [candidate division KSB1 bacterium]NIR70552.1 hypothetical protein [candidate division KSB1 bacterium]NIS27698.1 hypothetical protein [candidate division KSB1 bacterium]NIT74529.1 hypothetical protein [candidate division KSB1 bacterium]NIU28351.1 hypothetical protein [candidate division KSB1 bacterium]